MNENIIARIKAVMAAKGIGQAELVRRTGIRASSISDWLSGKYTPKQDKIDLMAAALGVSPAWLMYGKDEIESYYTDPETARLAQEAANDPEFRILLDAKRDLSPEDMQVIIDMAKRLLNRK
jgi:transcriptional regulator with XRE-family HTH domain